MTLDVQKKLDEMKVNYETHNEDDCRVFSMDEIGGNITVTNSEAVFYCGNARYKIMLTHKDAEKWLDTYLQESPEDFWSVVQDTEWNDLKRALFMNGHEAISNFLGYDYDETEEKDTTEERLNEAYEQMPREDFVQFYRQNLYNFKQ